MISPLAYVDPTAKLGNNVEIKPFAYIEGGVEIGDNCVIMPHVSILEGTTLGSGNIVYQNAVIGAKPQDFHFVEGSKTRVIIGNDNRIRENVVIAGSTYEGKATIVGNGNFIMDQTHICHDVIIHDKTVTGIGSIISGESELYEGCILSNNAIVQQHVRVGDIPLYRVDAEYKKMFLPMSSWEEIPYPITESTP